ncbi:MAG: glycosylhydrolase family 9 protein [Bacteroidetes bacterium]|nr:MAG: glycosylhydrolase family 9 protein [Bacteroidota bacterium]
MNAHNFCFLTNAQVFGGDNPVKEIYHGWFGDGSVFDDDNNPNSTYLGPPPGYMPGGINASYAPDAAYVGPPISPPQNQPVQKCYKDWNMSWPENSWEITEIAIYTNAAYVKLLAQFADSASVTTTIAAAANETSAVRLYPNPTQGTVMISGMRDAEFDFDLFDPAGRNVFSQHVHNLQQIDLSALSPAVYNCILRDHAGNMFSEKLVLLK